MNNKQKRIISHLKDRGLFVRADRKSGVQLIYNEPGEYTSWREIYTEYQDYDNHYFGNKGSMKEDRHRKNRNKTKHDINHENYDNFYHNKLRRDSNPWDHE